MPDRTCRVEGCERLARYAGRSCAMHYRQRRRATGEGPLPTVTQRCGWCDHKYTTTRLNGRYCSNSCHSYGSGRARMAVKLNWRHCDTCDLWWCHGNCPRRDTHPVKPPPDMSPRPCDSCGKAFTPIRPAGYFATYCSRACRDREARARYRHVGHGREFRTDRVIGRVRRWAIYERDGWRCQLCGGKVKPDLPWDDDGAATLDHVVPVSLGGRWEESNLQLAHRACNTEKGNRVWRNGEQLRLV